MQGDASARELLYASIYQELRRRAAGVLAGERPNHTLQPTALLHEAYLDLIRIRQIDWQSRGHFYAVAAKIMRQIVISHARARHADKRGGTMVRVELDAIRDPWVSPEPILLSLDSALDRLQSVSPRAYQLVEMKFFAGLSFEEAALALNVSSRTLKRDWEVARRWLAREIQDSEGECLE